MTDNGKSCPQLNNYSFSVFLIDEHPLTPRSSALEHRRAINFPKNAEFMQFSEYLCKKAMTLSTRA